MSFPNHHHPSHDELSTLQGRDVDLVGANESFRNAGQTLMLICRPVPLRDLRGVNAMLVEGDGCEPLVPHRLQLVEADRWAREPQPSALDTTAPLIRSRSRAGGSQPRQTSQVAL